MRVFHRRDWFIVLAGTTVVLGVAVRLGHNETPSQHVPSQSLLAAKSSIHVHDKSPVGQELLFSKASNGDLWLRDANNHERYLATNVVRATFSPDGKKIAYDTKDNEMLVETIEGKRLARLARASDHVWASNSAAIIFSATASPDYPQIEQTVIYKLTSNSLPETR